MNHLVIEGCPPWDGKYELPDFTFTNRELHRIKEISGIRGGEIMDALLSLDAGFYVAFAVVVLARNGKHASEDDLWDAEGASIRVEPGEDDDGPPAQSPSGDETPESNASSGTGSENVGD